MRRQTRCLTVVALSAGTILGIAGCSKPAANVTLPPPQKLVRVSRTAADREKLIKPGQFGGNGAANVRRTFFDFFNQQIIREDKEVGTVFMGDSITELWDLPVYFTPGLGETIENRGIAGDLASIMAKRFEADVIQLRPRNVVILAGTNDINWLPGQGKNADEIFTETVAALESMMDAAKAADINVLVCSILPTNDTFGMHTVNPGLRTRVNEQLKTSCAAKKCIYIDYDTALRDANGNLRKDLSDDGLHPHWAGYKIMARVLRETAKANGLRL